MTMFIDDMYSKRARSDRSMNHCSNKKLVSWWGSTCLSPLTSHIY